MILNYLKLSIRNIARQRVYSTINIIGLSVGIAACLILLSYVRAEWSFDERIPGSNSVYRVEIETVALDGDRNQTAGQPLPLAAALEQEFAIVEAATPVKAATLSVRKPGDEFYDESVYFVGASFFRVFPTPVLSGRNKKLLSAPEDVVLTASTAKNLFGNEDPVGQVIEISQGGMPTSFSVSAVIPDPGMNSSLDAGILIRIESFSDYPGLEGSWTSWGSNTFVRLGNIGDTDTDRESKNAEETLSSGLVPFTDAHYGPMMRTWKILKWMSPDPGSFHLYLRPLRSIHFANRVQQSHTESADPVYAYLSTVLALAILLLACINFTTLATARALQRAKEAGMRKVLGASRRQLIGQFQGEALLFTVLSLLLGLGLAQSLLPALGRSAGIHLDLGLLDLNGLLFISILTLTTAFLAGIYPSIFLSRFSPIDMIRQSNPLGRSRWMKALVVVQFALTGTFLFAALVIHGQLSFIETKNLGFDPHRLFAVRLDYESPSESTAAFERVANSLGEMRGVRGVSAASTGFDRSLAWNSFSTPDGGAHLIYTSRITSNYLEEMGIPMQIGRALSADFPGDLTGSVLVNQALVTEFGWTRPLEQTIEGFNVIGENPVRVVGVIDDFNFKSLHERIEPMVLFLAPRDSYRFLYFRIDPSEVLIARQSIAAFWNRVYPEKVFNGFFVDDDLTSRYTSERRWQHMIAYASLLAMLIACLGLFGLSTFSAQRRTKELGIRKVLGASSTGLSRMLSLEFLRLILLAETVALPVSFLVMNMWLERFAFRFNPGWFEAGVVLSSVLALALLSIGYQTIRASGSNPIVSLRYE